VPEAVDYQSDSVAPPQEGPWHRHVTGYQWLVLAIASAGWVFDAFEGQVFNLTRDDMFSNLLGPGHGPQQKFWGDIFLAIFLLGGTVGGIGFGNLADKVGRKPIMALTILFYSVFSGLTFFATSLWHVAVLRFLVALGVGGEWAVAASLVAEVFPPRARARAGGIFHATSVAGTWLAALAGLAVGTHWRYAYLMSIVPALLLVWVRSSIQEPERWKHAGAERQRLGSFRDLLFDRRWGPRALFGLLLAAIGLGTFWGVVVAGQDLTRELLLRLGWNAAEATAQSKIAFGFVQATGMGFGFLSMGPLAEWVGRRGAFLIMHVAAVIIVPVTCYLPHAYWQMLLILPFFGFFTGGMHAGYAIYFPELFPDRLRATGAGVCFNGGRLVAAPMLWFSAYIKSVVDLRLAIVTLSLFYVLGLFLLLALPETKGRPLPVD
jgi:MFS family permease